MTRGRMVRISEAWARLESQGERSLDLMESLEERGSAMDEGLGVELTRQRRLRREILEDLARGRTRPLRLALVGRQREALWRWAELLVPREDDPFSEGRGAAALPQATPFLWKGAEEEIPPGKVFDRGDSPSSRRGALELFIVLLPLGGKGGEEAFPEVEGILLLDDTSPSELPPGDVPWESVPTAPASEEDPGWGGRYALEALADRMLLRRAEKALEEGRAILDLGREGEAVLREIRASLREEAWDCGERLAQGEGFWEENVRFHALALGTLVREAGVFGSGGGPHAQLAKAVGRSEEGVRHHLRTVAEADFSRAAISMARHIFHPLERACWRPVRKLEADFLRRAREISLDGITLEPVPTFGAMMKENLKSFLGFLAASLLSLSNILMYLLMGFLIYGYIHYKEITIFPLGKIYIGFIFLYPLFALFVLFFFNNFTLFIKQIRILSLSKTLALARAWQRSNSRGYFFSALRSAIEGAEREICYILGEARRRIRQVLDQSKALERTYKDDLERWQHAVEDFCDVMEEWKTGIMTRRDR